MTECHSNMGTQGKKGNTGKKVSNKLLILMQDLKRCECDQVDTPICDVTKTQDKAPLMTITPLMFKACIHKSSKSLYEGMLWASQQESILWYTGT